MLQHLFILSATVMLAAGCASRGKTVIAPAANVPIDSFTLKRDFLRLAIDSLLSDTLLFQANCGIYIISLEPEQEIYSLNRSSLLIPASVNKLLVTAAAYRQLGINYSFQTSVYGDSIDGQGIIKQDLYLKGFGDPELRTADLEALAYRLRSMGLKQVNGDLIADAGHFDTTSFGFGWMWDEGPYAFNAPISALSLNRNTFEVGLRPGARSGRLLKAVLNPTTAYLRLDNQGRTIRAGDKSKPKVTRNFSGDGDVVSITGTMALDEGLNYLTRTVTNPSLYCGTVFREALARNGIKILVTVISDTVPSGKPELTWHLSPPLYQIIRNMNKESDNLTAEMIFRHLSADDGANAGDSSQSNKLADMLKNMGFGQESFRVVDGSGLSRYNLCSPEQLVRVLSDVYNDPALRPELLVSLPISGTDGTLSQRFIEDEYRGKIRAKTGTLTGVSSLAGFVFAPQNKTYCFAIMFNNYISKANSVRAIQDSILARLILISP